MPVPRAALVGAFGVGLAVSLVGALLFVDVILLGVSTEKDCLNRCFGTGKCCVVWNDNMCWRGDPEKTMGECKKRSIALPVSLLSAGGAIALVSLVWFSLSKDDPFSSALQLAYST